MSSAIADGLRRAGVKPIRCPVADGGEGTLDVLLAARGGRFVEAGAQDPLRRTIEAGFAILEGEPITALVESARAIGLDRLALGERDPWLAGSRGAGQLIVAADRAGAERILVATGGTATMDGGIGATEAIREAGGLGEVELIVLCDVDTPWERCAATFGPQKGADPGLVEKLAGRLDALAGSLPRDPRGVARTGAAGGLSGALWANFGADLRSGAEHVLEACEFDSRLAAADAVIVGEGRLDEQSLEGKVLGEITARARRAGVPVHALVGRNELDQRRAAAVGIATISEATSLPELESAARSLALAWSGAR